MECKLLHCEYRASRGVDYQSMPLQCIVFSGLNVKVDYLIIRHEDSRMRYKRGVPWAEAIPVNFCEIRRSTKKLGTL